MTRFFLLLLRLYRRTLSPDHGVLRGMFPLGVCRYTPTCSEYLEEAIVVHGLLSGLRLGFQRVLRCHPFGASGHDPVPRRDVTILPLSTTLSGTRDAPSGFEWRAGTVPHRRRGERATSPASGHAGAASESEGRSRTAHTHTP